jgi:hypothetical protein
MQLMGLGVGGGGELNIQCPFCFHVETEHEKRIFWSGMTYRRACADARRSRRLIYAAVRVCTLLHRCCYSRGVFRIQKEFWQAVYGCN